MAAFPDRSSNSGCSVRPHSHGTDDKFGSAHRQLANRAMLEEMLAQLQQLSASGLEAVGAGTKPPDETDSESEAPT